MLIGMDLELAQQYVKVRAEIERLVANIHAISWMMRSFEEMEEGTVDIKPGYIATLGRSIADDVIRIIELLDNDFVPASDIQTALKQMNKRVVSYLIVLPD